MSRGFSTTFGAGSTDAIATTSVAPPVAMTFAIWTYRNGEGGNSAGRIIQLSGGNASLIFNSGAAIYQLQADFTVTDGLWTVNRPTGGVWHHLAIAYDALTIFNDPIFYIDGSSVAVTEVTIPSGTWTSTATQAILGNNTGTGGVRVWDGIFAEFGWWNRVLTAAEVVALSKGLSPSCMPNGLLEHVPMIRDLYGRTGVTAATGTAVRPHIRTIIPRRRSMRRFTTGAAAAPSSVGHRIIGGGWGGRVIGA